MIPKIIHYCWFGKGEIKDSDLKCIESWHQVMPDYQIKRWDESNFDVESCDYSKEAYEARKWAYVSDAARFIILYQEGGFFLDTDVQVIRRFDSLLEESCVWGMERPDFSVNPGSLVGSVKRNVCIKNIMDMYMNEKFINPDNATMVMTSPAYVTRELKKCGFRQENYLQKFENFTVYPCEYFAPMNVNTGLLDWKTENTYSVHLYNFSWGNLRTRKWHFRKYKLNRIFGICLGTFLYRVWNFPERIYFYFIEHGFISTLSHGLKRIFSK